MISTRLRPLSCPIGSLVSLCSQTQEAPNRTRQMCIYDSGDIDVLDPGIDDPDAGIVDNDNGIVALTCHVQYQLITRGVRKHRTIITFRSPFIDEHDTSV